MKKFITSLFCLIVLGQAVFAQNEVKTSSKTEYSEDETTVIVNGFTKNWDISLSVGVQDFLGEYTSATKTLGLWSAPAFDFQMQKWASPYFAVGFGIDWAPVRSLYSTGDSKAIFAKSTDRELYGYHEMTGSFINPFAKLGVDLTNLLLGYRSDRGFNFIAYAGGGVAIPTSECVYRSVTPTFNAGLTAQMKVTERWSVNVNARGALVSDNFNGISYMTSGDVKNIPMDGLFGVTAGLTYRFGYTTRTSRYSGKRTTQAWVPMETAVTTSETFYNVVDGLNATHSKEMAVAEKQVEEAVAEVEKVKEEEAAVEQSLEVYKDKASHALDNYEMLVNFAIDKSSVTNREKINVAAAAAVIKANPDAKFVVTGYADKQTATEKYNQKLSEKRADAVYDMLVNEFGVNADQLVKEAKGGVDYLYYNDAQCSRSAIISLQK